MIKTAGTFLSPEYALVLGNLKQSEYMRLRISFYFRLFVSEALQGCGCARKFHQFPRKTWDRVGAMHQDKTGRSAFAFRTMAPLIYP